MNSKDYFLEYKTLKATIALKHTELATMQEDMVKIQREIAALERQASEVAALGMAKFEEETQ
jgi:hypothetical protein